MSLPIVLTLSAYGLLQGSSCHHVGLQAESQKPVAPALPGQLVAEIDPRIWDIFQDRSGDLWFGSNGAGVYRFDGETATQYTEKDGLPGGQVRDIAQHSNGHILISTNRGVARFDSATFHVLDLVDPNSTEDAWRLHDDDAWIVFQPGDHGPCRYDGEKLYHLELSKNPAVGSERIPVGTPKALSSGIYSIYKDRNGHMWFGTAGVGLCRYDGETLSWMLEEPLSYLPGGGVFGIRSIYQDRANDFWICNTRQRFEVSPEITRADGNSLIQYRKKEGFPEAQTDTEKNFTFYPSMVEDPAGTLWIAAGGDGIWSFDGKAVVQYPLGGDIYAIKIFCDLKGTLWVGTVADGIHRFNGKAFEKFQLPIPKK